MVICKIKNNLIVLNECSLDHELEDSNLIWNGIDLENIFIGTI